MPPFIVLLIAGAGLYAGAKWVARHAGDARVAADAMRKRSSAGPAAPRDLGPLEFDSEAKVYRPRPPLAP